MKAIFRMLLEGGWIKYRSLFLCLAAVTSVFIGWLDYVTTDQVDLSFLYLVPIFFTTMAAGRAGGLWMALVCAAIKIVTDVYSDQPFTWAVYYAFNGVGLFAAFASFALLLDMLRTSYTRECEVYRKDRLTGLPNRQAFLAAMDATWESGRRLGQFALLILDLDDFKAYNAASGYHMGDIALQTLARSLSKGLKPDAAAYRIGGDDFAVVVAPDAEKPLRQLAEDMRERLSQALGGKGCGLDVSVCVLSCKDFGGSLEDMLRRVEAELHRAKQEQGSGIIIELAC